MKLKICSIDIESTGLNEDTCDILEFGAVLDDLSVQKPIEELPFFHCYVLPPNGKNYTVEPYAASMHPVIFRRIAERESPYTYVNPMKMGYGFKMWLVNNGYPVENDKVYINAAGKNFASFDLQFLKRKTDLLKHVRIRHKILDPSNLLFNDLDEVLPGTEECLRRCGESVNVQHTAIEDAKDVIRMIRCALM